MRSIVRSLRHRNFRLYFVGQGLSVTGTWMQSVAIGWLVYRMTGSKTLLGLAGFVSQILTFLVAPLAGVLADRWDRRRAIIGAQVVAMVQAAMLAALVLSSRVEVWHVIALSVFTGLVRGFEVPTRQSFIVQMLDDPADLPNAIALNSFMVNTARLVGPILAGAIIAAGGGRGEGWVFLVNAVSYAAIITALAQMRIAPRPRAEADRSVLAGLREGIAYAWRTPTIRTVLGMLALASLVAVPYANLLPAFAKDKDLLAGGPDTLGYLMGATGVGALVAGAAMAYRRRAVRLDRTLRLSAVLFGAGLVVFALVARFGPGLEAAVPVLVWIGLAMTALFYAANTLLQTTAAEDKRGRVMSLYTMAFMGVIPFGAMAMGWAAEVLDRRLAVLGPAFEALGAPVVVAAGGALLIVGAVVLGRFLPRGVVTAASTAGDAEPAS